MSIKEVVMKMCFIPYDVIPNSGWRKRKRHKCYFRLSDGVAYYDIVGRKGKITRLTTWEIDYYGQLSEWTVK